MNHLSVPTDPLTTPALWSHHCGQWTREGKGWEWGVEIGLVALAIALRPQTSKHIRGGWLHYTDISEPVDEAVGTLQL
jgi:hypothetical protein